MTFESGPNNDEKPKSFVDHMALATDVANDLVKGKLADLKQLESNDFQTKAKEMILTLIEPHLKSLGLKFSHKKFAESNMVYKELTPALYMALKMGTPYKFTPTGEGFKLEAKNLPPLYYSLKDFEEFADPEEDEEDLTEAPQSWAEESKNDSERFNEKMVQYCMEKYFSDIKLNVMDLSLDKDSVEGEFEMVTDKIAIRIPQLNKVHNAISFELAKLKTMRATIDKKSLFDNSDAAQNLRATIETSKKNNQWRVYTGATLYQDFLNYYFNVLYGG